MVKQFFKDKQGHWAIIQIPNLLLSGWIIITVVNFFVRNPHISTLQNTVLFAWAYLELTEGASYFRRTLGVIILIGVTVALLM